MTSMGAHNRQDMLAFLEREVPVHTLDSYIVDCLETVPPENRCIRRDPTTGTLSWWIPEASEIQSAWPTPDPVAQDRKLKSAKPLRPSSKASSPPSLCPIARASREDSVPKLRGCSNEQVSDCSDYQDSLELPATFA